MNSNSRNDSSVSTKAKKQNNAIPSRKRSMASGQSEKIIVLSKLDPLIYLSNHMYFAFLSGIPILCLRLLQLQAIRFTET